MSKTGFQDDSCGSHLKFLISKVLFAFDLQVILYIMGSHFYICRLLQKRNVVDMVTIYVSNQRYIIMPLKMYIIKIEKTFQSKHFKCQMYQNTLFFSHNVIIFFEKQIV